MAGLRIADQLDGVVNTGGPLSSRDVRDAAAKDRLWPRWNGHRLPFGDAGTCTNTEALPNRSASMCQSGVSTRPL